MERQEKKLKYCGGCNNDFYNGNNTLKIEECWSLGSARIVKRKKIHINLCPPYDHINPQKVLNCYHQKGYVFWE